MKDIICRYAFSQEMLIWSFLRNTLYPFWTLAKIILCNSDETGFYCPIVRHKWLELPLVVYIILRQCWSVGYVSLLNLSFIRSWDDFLGDLAQKASSATNVDTYIERYTCLTGTRILFQFKNADNILLLGNIFIKSLIPECKVFSVQNTAFL